MTDERTPMVRPWFSDAEGILEDFRQILQTGLMTNFGPFSRQLEAQMGDKLGVSSAIAVSSATMGLTLACDTLPVGSEVILPSFTFAATLMPLLWNPRRLVPVFAEIDPNTLTIDPDCVRQLITSRTSAVLAVDVFGVPCRYRELKSICEQSGIRFFCDSAHSMGALYQDRSIGSQADLHVLSLSATKVLPCGEGGLVTTNDVELSEAILRRRNYGYASDRDSHNLGLNAKMTEFCAAIALRELSSLESRVQTRGAIAARYRARLCGVPGIRLQSVTDGAQSCHKDVVIRVDEREFGASRAAVRAALTRHGVETESYFDPPCHRLAIVREMLGDSCRCDLTVTEEASETILSLPVHEHLTMDQVDAVADYIIEVSVSSYR